jgi:MFS family permease
MKSGGPSNVFYGWWIVAAAFLNLFFAVGIIFYGFPVFYPALVQGLGFTRAQITQGFLLGFFLAGLPFGLLAGTLIDKVGARWIIFSGVGFIGIPLLLMGFMTKLWHYELLCVIEILGYVLSGPIANQVLIARWFRAQRGRAMGYAYLGLGLGGMISPVLVNSLIRSLGWRHAFEVVGLVILMVLFPVGIWITRSTPEEMGLLPDGLNAGDSERASPETLPQEIGVADAIRTANFWLIVVGSTLAIGAVGAVIQHLILFLEDQRYSATTASRFSAVLLASSLCGRVLVGYVADRWSKKNVMAVFYFVVGASIFLLDGVRHPGALWSFVLIFGFSMGADYMLIPLVTAECFGTASLGKLLAVIIMSYSLGQWGAPWLVGRIFETQGSYDLAWRLVGAAGLLGAATIYAISPRQKKLELVR